MGLQASIKASLGASAVLGGLLPILLIPTQVQAQGCYRPILTSSPPPIVERLTNVRDNVIVWIRNASIISVLPTGSMRPAIHDGSRLIIIPPEPRLLMPGRVILFHSPGRNSPLVLHRIYAKGIDSPVPLDLLGTSASGWSLAWDGQWYAPGITPPDPPIETRYWRTWGDNNCLPDFWEVRYKDILGVMVGVIE